MNIIHFMISLDIFRILKLINKLFQDTLKTRNILWGVGWIAEFQFQVVSIFFITSLLLRMIFIVER